MTEARYAPGELCAVVTDAGAALIAADLSPTTLARIWERMREGRGFPAVLEALTGAFGTSLTAIPSFAVVLLEGGAARVAVRGDLVVEVTGGSGSELVTGTGVTTWSERVIVTPEAMTLRGRVAVPAELPVRDGVVLAAAVAIAMSAAASAPTPAAGTPVVAPLTQPAPPAEPPAAAPAAPGTPTTSAVPAVPVVPSMPVVPLPEPSAADGATVDVLATLIPTSSTIPPPVSGAPAEERDGLISSVPLGETPTAAVPAEPGAADSAYDHLWGATVIRSVEDAAVREEPDAAEAAASEAEADERAGDHDGRTISVAEARALRQLAGADAADSVPPLAAPRAAAPGRIVLSTGQVVLLDRTVVVGRRPRSTRVVGTDLPHLVAVESPGQDISRSHLELRVEGESILATDLHTTNGTMLVRAGSDPVRLHPGEPTVVMPGDVIDLGDGQTLQVEGLA
jgi:hypothetical protein